MTRTTCDQIGPLHLLNPVSSESGCVNRGRYGQFAQIYEGSVHGRLRGSLHRYRTQWELSYGMHQAIVYCHLHRLNRVAVLEYWKAQRARCRRRRWCLGARTDRQAAMHKHLSRTLSRLSSSEPVAVVRVSECLPGLHPIYLYWSGTGMNAVPSAARPFHPFKPC
jgi:hypothetical protein